MAKLVILSTLTPGVEKGKIVKDGSTFDLLKGDKIQFNEKTAIVSYFKRGDPNLLFYEIEDGSVFAATPEDLAMVQKVTGGRKTRKSRKSRKSRKTRRYRRV